MGAGAAVGGVHGRELRRWLKPPACIGLVSRLAPAVGLLAGVRRCMVTGSDSAAVVAFEPEHHDVARVATRAGERLGHGKRNRKTRTVYLANRIVK
jgi:hypothetical protein